MRWIRGVRGNLSQPRTSDSCGLGLLVRLAPQRQGRQTDLKSLLAEYFFELTLKRLHVFRVGAILGIVARDEA